MLKFPDLSGLKSKNKLAHCLSSRTASYEQRLKLINECKNNHQQLWYDQKDSDEEKGKFIRSAKEPLRTMLSLISNKLLAPYDKSLLPFIWGGVSEKSAAGAAKVLAIKSKDRFLLKMDLSKFFEQVTQEDVYSFFLKSHCDKKVAYLLSELCCVSKGKKGSEEEKLLARGFSPSPRLAVWCNYSFFVKVYNKIKDRLKGKRFKVVYFIDDIGVSVEGSSIEELEDLYLEIKDIAEDFGVILNDSKKEILTPDKAQEHLGVLLRKNGKLGLTQKTLQKKKNLKQHLKNASLEEKESIKLSLNGIYRYEDYVKSL